MADIGICVRVVELSPFGMSQTQNTNPGCARTHTQPRTHQQGLTVAKLRLLGVKACLERSQLAPTPSPDRLNRRFRPDISHLYLQQLLMVGGVHLLQGLLKLMVPVQEGFPQLRRQVEICKHRAAASTQGATQAPTPCDPQRM